jgi:predicted N-acetyltransferase YhbS
VKMEFYEEYNRIENIHWRLVGKLIVCSDFQNRGMGIRLLNEIEQTFSRASRFEL